MRPTINIDKGPIAIVNELLAKGEVVKNNKIRATTKSKKVERGSG